MRSIPPRAAIAGLALLAVTGASSPLVAQDSAAARADTARRHRPDSAARIARLAPIGVTATRAEQSVFRTAVPLFVLDSSVIREETPNGIADLFRNLPGVDVTGVGPNQGRLMIRGQRGQRILLTEDGVRINNARRQQDFGELPALTDLNMVSRVEVLRGPAAVLYGTDAVGGVVNQITMRPPGSDTPGAVKGTLLYRYGSAEGQNLVHARVSGRSGRLGFTLGAGYRNADPYEAPAGTFGQLRLGARTLVNDTGIEDRTYSLGLSYSPAPQQRLGLRISRYQASRAGFGYVDPLALGDPSGVVVRLLYPTQAVTRVTAAYEASALGWALADRFTATAYTTQNGRTFDQQIDIPFGAPFPPGAGIAIRSSNRTDIATYGARLEAAKVLGAKHLLVYGMDWFLDHSTNRDTSTTTSRMFGPPSVRTSGMPTVPNADFWSGGAFARADLQLAERFALGLGARAQAIHATTRNTPGLPPQRAGLAAANQTLIAGASALFRVVPELHLVATVGRAFRAPNLVERYFEGVAAEGSGFQMANPTLEPETSLNYDLGMKFRNDRFYAEVVYFVNTISGGIRITPLDTTINSFPAFQNQNVQKLRDRGLEVLVEASVGRGLSLVSHYTRLDSKNADQNSPVGDSYSSKLGGELAWREARGRFFAAYEVRHQGERKDVLLVGSPVGDTLPAFTTHAVRMGARLPTVLGTTPSLALTVANLTNALYAETSNTSFFRPEPRRSAILAVRVDF